MSTYRYAVKVHRLGYLWRAACPVCGEWTWEGAWESSSRKIVRRLYRWATLHAATCKALHRANLAAACPSCKAYGRVAHACPVCLGRGYEAERNAK